MNVLGNLTEEQRAAHIRALLRELEHNKARLKGHEARKEDDAAEHMRRRITEVEAALRDAGQEAKKPSDRAERRAR